MDKDTEEWFSKLVAQLDPHEVQVNNKETIVGYIWNRKKRTLYLISQKEANKLTRKGIVWKHLKEDWDK